MKKTHYFKSIGLAALLFSAGSVSAQTNVFDDVIAVSPNHTYLEAALIQEGLDVALQDPSGTFTVFAPDDNAFTALATALNTDINGLLALQDLDQILLYHVLGVTADAASVTNGAVVPTLNTTNTIKLTKTSMGSVYANQAMVNAADLTTANGIVHSIDAVILPNETVVDVAIDNGFTSLYAAVVQAELLPALTNPLAALTVFAPTNQAFDDLAAALNTDINGLLALPNLADVLLYHVIGSEVLSGDLSNGLIAPPLSSTNTLKITVTSNSEVFINQAQVTLADVLADNGVVHVLNEVVLPFETVVDVAIDNGFTSLTAAVIEAELLPALTDPFAELTVFAPTNQAFDDLAAALGTDLNGVLASPNLTEILLYHVVSGNVLSTDLTNGPVPTLNGQTVNVTLGNPVTINSSNVAATDLQVFNGVVHVIDAVLVPSFASIEEGSLNAYNVFPNPTSDKIVISGGDADFVEIIDQEGRTIDVLNDLQNGEEIILGTYNPGLYLIKIIKNGVTEVKRVTLL